MGTDASEPQAIAATGESQGSGEVLTPDAVILAGEGQEGRGVNADEAYPGLDRVDLTGGRRRSRGGRARGGNGQAAGKQQERDRNR